MVDDPLRYFRPEARELLERLSRGALDLEEGRPPAEIVPALLRHAHTLKGAARVVRQNGIAELSHAVEDALVGLKERRAPLTAEESAALLRSLDEIGSSLAEIEAAAPGAAAVQKSSPSAADEAFRMLRVDIADLDALLNALSEAEVRAGSIRGALDRLRGAQRAAERLSSTIRHDGASPRVTALVDELQAAIAELGRTLPPELERLQGELRSSQAIAGQIRLFPVSVLFPTLTRAARDAAELQGAKVALETRGGETRLDATVIAALQSPLVQLVRNAVVHGIEQAKEREARGKPAKGRIVVEVVRRGKSVYIRCEDDGRGIDLDAVRRAALDKGILSEAEISDPRLLDLLLRGGITTSTAASQAAGRGVGLDIVRDAVQRLGGKTSIRSRFGEGTAMEIVVPLSISSLDCLLVETAGVVAAIPIDAVRRTRLIASSDLVQSGDGAGLVEEGRVLPFTVLSDSLDLESDDPLPAAWPVAIVGRGSESAAIGFHRLIGSSSIVSRTLSPVCRARPIVAGAALDDRGSPLLVLDPHELASAAMHTRAHGSPVRARRLPILVVDDSLTTRMLEQSILESAGYEVDLSSSGEEGLEMARATRYGLFLVDIEMPGIDGFTFVEEVRADARLRDTPVILITSRSSDDDRRRGLEVGAQAYVAKSEFDQAALLGTIRRLTES